MRARTFGGALLVSTAIATLGAGASFAQDAFMDEAKAYIETVTAPVTEWTGPTTGPQAQSDKLVIYVSDDQRNGGARGVGDGAEEAAEAIGWDFRLLDGQGAPATRASALTQAIALQPDGIILGTIDAREQAPLIEQAVAQGIKVVGWHSGGAPGPIEGVPGVITNITTDPLEVAKASGLYAVVDSGGTAGVIIFTDSIYAIAIAKSDATAEAVKGCSGCNVLETVDTPIGDLQNRMGQLTTSLLSKYGDQWTYSVAVNDLYYDFAAPSLQNAGIDPAEGYPRNISAGDGSVPAFQRIRDGQYQVATVAEPLYLHGWQTIDELNRAFADEEPSDYVAPPHLFIRSNIDADGGDQDIFDPGNGYRDEYKKIWGVQ
jgi:ribose transport system substrate-binding protein